MEFSFIHWLLPSPNIFFCESPLFSMSHLPLKALRCHLLRMRINTHIHTCKQISPFQLPAMAFWMRIEIRGAIPPIQALQMKKKRYISAFDSNPDGLSVFSCGKLSNPKSNWLNSLLIMRWKVLCNEVQRCSPLSPSQYLKKMMENT